MTSEAELAQAFYPGTIEGLADEWWRLNCEIGEMKKSRDLLEQIVLEHCMKNGPLPENDKRPAVEAADYLADVKSNGQPVWKWRLAVVREGRDARRKAL